MRKVALDLGKRKVTFCEVSDGQVVARATANSLAGLERYVGPQRPPAQVAIEACREAWVIHDRLKAWGHEPVLVDTTRVKRLGIGQHGRKTDRIDAETLARALESGTIPVAHVLSPERRRLRLQLQVRRALVEARAQYTTTIRGLVRARGGHIADCKTEQFSIKVSETLLDEETRELIAPLEKLLPEFGTQIASVETKLVALCRREPAVELLATAHGVGLIVAAAFVSVIDEAHRFKRAHEVESYLGLVPREDSSGGRRRIGSITKEGNGYVRAMLVQAAWCILRQPDDPLARWGEAVAQRRGKRVAVIAVARRLAGVLWAMWRDGTVYEPARLERPVSNGLPRQSAQLQIMAMRRAARKMSPKRAV